MLDDKAYLRAVRGHHLIYEAGWLKSWLAEHDEEFEEFVQSVGQVFKKHNNAGHRAKLYTAIDHLAVRCTS